MPAIYGYLEDELVSESKFFVFSLLLYPNVLNVCTFITLHLVYKHVLHRYIYVYTTVLYIHIYINTDEIYTCTYVQEGRKKVFSTRKT